MISHIVADVGGTTTDIKFGADVLLPYARSRMHDFLNSESSHLGEISKCVANIRDYMGNPHASAEQVANQCLEWMDDDVTPAQLKSLQELIWVSGYNSGVLKGHVYEDAKHQLIQWHAEGLVLGVYSSASVQAQKQLFGHSTWGDLSVLFSYFFDTQIGSKREVGSYQSIVENLSVRSGQILFISDVRQELDAAAFAGMLTIGVNRYDRDAVGTHPTVESFSQIDLKQFEL